MIEVGNDGPRIAATNYWQSEPAGRGLCYLSGNAGAWRLLVPAAAENLLAEMRTGTRVTIEPSIRAAGAFDVVFEDGTDSPFSITLDKRMIDRAMTSGQCAFTVWTARGLELDLPCYVADA